MMGDYALSRMNAESVRNYIDEQITKAKDELARAVADMPGVSAHVDNLRFQCLKEAIAVHSEERLPAAELIKTARSFYDFATGKEEPTNG